MEIPLWERDVPHGCGLSDSLGTLEMEERLKAGGYNEFSFKHAEFQVL